MDPRRTVETLRREVWVSETDALFLQEADEERSPHRGILDLSAVEKVTGLRHQPATCNARAPSDSHGILGVVAFLHPDIVVEGVRVVDLPGHCPRAAMILDIVHHAIPIRLVLTHLSLSQILRVAQMRTIGQHLDRFDRRPVLLCGDLNEWRMWGGLALSRRVVGRRLTGPARATFPVGRPMLPLDRVMVSAPGRVETVKVLDGPGIRVTSDHRPILATASFEAVPSM